MDQNSKEKLFFFGQPGCLKVKFDIPIRPSDSENETEENSNLEVTSKNSLNDENDTMKRAENTSDDDGEELLKKIDEALEDQNTENPENIGISGKSNDKSISENSMNDIKEEQIIEENKSESALEIASPANKETISEINVKSVNSLDDDKNISKLDECIEGSDLLRKYELEKSVEIVNKSEETEPKERSNEAIETERPPIIKESLDHIGESNGTKHDSANDMSMCSQNKLVESVPIKEEISLIEVKSHTEDTDKIDKNIECTNPDDDQQKNNDNNTEEISHSETQISSKMYTQDTQSPTSLINNEVVQSVITETSDNYETHLESKVHEECVDVKELENLQIVSTEMKINVTPETMIPEQSQPTFSESKPTESMDEKLIQHSDSLTKNKTNDETMREKPEILQNIGSDLKADESIDNVIAENSERLPIICPESKSIDSVVENLPEKSENLKSVNLGLKADESIDKVVSENLENSQNACTELVPVESMNEIATEKSENLTKDDSIEEIKENPEILQSIGSKSKQDDCIDKVVLENPESMQIICPDMSIDKVASENPECSQNVCTELVTVECMDEIATKKSESFVKDDSNEEIKENPTLQSIGQKLKQDDCIDKVVLENPESMQIICPESKSIDSVGEIAPEKSENLKSEGSELKSVESIDEMMPENLEISQASDSKSKTDEFIDAKETENSQTVSSESKLEECMIELISETSEILETVHSTQAVSSESKVDLSPQESEISETIFSGLKINDPVNEKEPQSLQSVSSDFRVEECMAELTPQELEKSEKVHSELNLDDHVNEKEPLSLQSVSSDLKVDDSLIELIPENTELQTADPEPKIYSESENSVKLPIIQEGKPQTVVEPEDQKIKNEEICSESSNSDLEDVSQEKTIGTQNETDEPTFENDEKQITESVIDQNQKSPLMVTDKLEADSDSIDDAHENQENESFVLSDPKETRSDEEISEEKVILEDQQQMSIEMESQTSLSGEFKNENENIVESPIQELPVVPDESIISKSDENLIIQASHSRDVINIEKENPTVLSEKGAMKNDEKVEASLSEESQESKSNQMDDKVVESQIQKSKEEILASYSESHSVCETFENESEIIDEKSIDSVQDKNSESPETSQEPQDLSVEKEIEDKNDHPVSVEASECDEKGKSEILSVQTVEENVSQSATENEPLSTESEEVCVEKNHVQSQNVNISPATEELSDDSNNEKSEISVTENQLPEPIDIEQEKIHSSESMHPEQSNQDSELRMETECEITQSAESMESKNDNNVVLIANTQECEIETKSCKDDGSDMVEQITEISEEKHLNLESSVKQPDEPISITAITKNALTQEEILSEPRNEIIEEDSKIEEPQNNSEKICKIQSPDECQDTNVKDNENITESDIQDDKLNLDQKTDDSREEVHENVQFNLEANEASHEKDICIASSVDSQGSIEKDEEQPTEPIEVISNPIEDDVEELNQESTSVDNIAEENKISKQDSKTVDENNQNKASNESKFINVLQENSDESSSSESIQSDLEIAPKSHDEINLQKEIDKNQEQVISYAENTEKNSDISADNKIQEEPHIEEMSKVEMEAQNESIDTDSSSVVKDNDTCGKTDKLEEVKSLENQIEASEKIDMTVSEIASETDEIIMNQNVESTSKIEIESKIIPDVKESQNLIEKDDSYRETKSNNEIPLKIETSVVENAKIIPQKAITVEQNSNEKINDNQVELSKNDNKSSSIEKVSSVENINIQIESIDNLNKSSSLDIVQEKDLDEDNSNLHINDKIKLVSDEIVVKKSEILDTVEHTDKQYELVTEQPIENVPSKSDFKDFKEEINIDKGQEYSVQNLTDKMISNNVAESDLCADNNNDKIERVESSKHADDIKSNLEIGNSIDNKPADINNEPESEEIVLPTKESNDEKPAQQNTIVETVMMFNESSDQECSNKTQEEHEKTEIQISGDTEQAPVDPFEEVEAQKSNNFDQLMDKKPELESIPITKAFSKPAATRKRKMSERKSISESDSDGGSHFVTDSVSNEKSSDEETVATKKPRIRNKITATRNTRATRQSARVSEEIKTAVVNKVQKLDEPKLKSDDSKEKNDEEKTLQSLKFDYDENEDVAANMAAIKNLICKDTSKKEDIGDDSNDSSADESDKKKPVRKGRKGKRSRATKKNDAQESSSDESKSAKVPDSKRSKTSESEETTVEKQSKKKRDSSGKGILKHIDTSLVIETVETEAPIRQSRRIAQQKIREETERRQMEEKMLKQMKEEAERKKKLALIPEPPEDDDSSDESYKDSRKKKKKKLKPSDKPWQTSSSHSEHSESEDEFERPHSEDPGSPLFRSDHEFSPESDVDDTAPVQPMKRARTAKKQELSSDDEDVNPNHACQVCHKTDCPEWILLCDECDHGYHCSCLKPIIFCIPSGNWYCPLCCHKKLIDNLSVQLEILDTLIYNIKAEEIRQQKQLEIKKLTEITEENILRDRRKNRPEHAKDEQTRDSKSRKLESDQENESEDESSDNSSDNEPLNEVFYKLRRRNQTTTSYRFNDYDDLINSAIRDEMEEVKGMGNAGRGKDISTIIEADKEEKKQQKLVKDKEKVVEESSEKPSEQQEGEESSGSEIIRPKKSMQRKKKNRKLNNLDETSEEDKASDEDFKGSGSTNSDSEEEYTMSSVSESSLDLPLKKKSKTGPRSTRSAARNRRYQETFINDNSSDDEPLIKKRNKKQIDSDEEEFDVNEDENSDASSAEDIDSEDLCDDTETDDSSENNWPRKKKKKIASYDVKKPRKPAKKNDEGNDKAFRAGISKKKILKQSDNESEGSDNDSVKGRRKTRGKKLLYLIEDDYESDDGIKPGIGVVRPETPPEERELFVKKQEEIKRMLAEKNTEAAKQLAVPTIEPLKFSIEKPKSPSPPPLTSSEAASLSIVPKNVIEGAKALDMDYNKIKPAHFGIHSKSSDHPSAHDMSEEDLARMMEEEDFAQHQLKLVGESIGRNKLLDLPVKEEAFAAFSKGGKAKDEKDLAEIQPPVETKKRARKPKPEKYIDEPLKPMQSVPSPQTTPSPQHIMQPNVPIKTTANEPIKPSTSQMSNIPSVPPLISNPVSHPPYPNLPLRYPGPSPHPLNIQDRPSVLSNYLPRHEGMPPRLEGMPQHMRFPQPLPENFHHKPQTIIPHLQSQPPPSEEVEEKKKGRRKKYTPLRSDLPESNVPKVAKLDTAAPSSVIHSTLNLSTERPDDKNKVPPLQRAKTASVPEAFNPATNPASVITRLLQPQQRLPFGGFAEQINVSPTNPSNPSTNSRGFPEDMKHHPISKQIRPGPPAQFAENPFAPRGIHTLYRGPPTSQPSIYGIPSHNTRLLYPFHHLHPNSNLRPNIQEYGAPYNIPPQFGYYAPPAHSRQHPTNPPAPSANHPEHPEIPPNSARPNNNSNNSNEETSESSEFGGLVSYFSSQQELD